MKTELEKVQELKEQVRDHYVRAKLEARGRQINDLLFENKSLERAGAALAEKNLVLEAEKNNLRRLLGILSGWAMGAVSRDERVKTDTEIFAEGWLEDLLEEIRQTIGEVGEV